MVKLYEFTMIDEHNLSDTELEREINNAKNRRCDMLKWEDCQVKIVHDYKFNRERRVICQIWGDKKYKGDI